MRKLEARLERPMPIGLAAGPMPIGLAAGPMPIGLAVHGDERGLFSET